MSRLHETDLKISLESFRDEAFSLTWDRDVTFCKASGDRVSRHQGASTVAKAFSLTHGNLVWQATSYAVSTEKDYQGRVLKETLSFLKMRFCPQNIVNCINGHRSTIIPVSQCNCKVASPQYIWEVSSSVDVKEQERSYKDLHFKLHSESFSYRKRGVCLNKQNS